VIRAGDESILTVDSQLETAQAVAYVAGLREPGDTLPGHGRRSVISRWERCSMAPYLEERSYAW
jgi:hypothetical protein